MASKIITFDSGEIKGKAAVTFVAGLEWRVLAARGDSALRDMAKERSATHAAVLKIKKAEAENQSKGQKNKGLGREVAGFYVSVDGASPPNKSYSVAALFSGWISEHPKALLCYDLQAESKGAGWLVVVSIDGMPVVDAMVPTWDDAQELIETYLNSPGETSVVSNDPVRYPQTIKADNILPALSHYASNNKEFGRIKAVPADIKKLVLLTLVVAVGVVGYFYYQKNEKENERKKALAERLEKDPSALYKKALSVQGPRLGFSRDSLARSFDSLMLLPMKTGGWTLKGVTCSDVCTAQYHRATGTIESLQASIKTLGPNFALVSPSAGAVDLEKAWITVPSKNELAGVEPSAPSHQEFLQGKAATKLQSWRTAGLSIQIQTPQLWPQVSGVPAAFKAPNSIAVGKLEVSGIALPLVKEVMSSAPENIVWQDFTLEVADVKIASNPLDTAKVKINGVFYVKN